MLGRAHLVLFSLVYFISFGLNFEAQAQGPSCNDVFQPLESRMAKFDPGLLAAFQRFQKLDPSLISGERTPKWADFHQLQQVVEALRLLKGVVRSAEDTAELNEIIAQLARVATQDPSLNALANAHRTYVPLKTYRPTEYELKLYYQFLIGRLNRELPRELRIPLQRLPLDQRRARINRDAREFMTEFIQDFDARFADSEFKTYEEYEKAIRNNPDPTVQKAIELIDKNQIEVVIRRPLSARFWVPKVGFQNQYVTNSSRGYLDRDRRQQAEARLYGLERTVGESALATYQEQDPEFMPKYATLRPSPESGVQYDAAGSVQYGPDFYVIRLTDIQDRLTWTPGDSLGWGWMTGPLEKWDDTFIPWERRLLMVGYMLNGLSTNTMNGPTRTSLIQSRFSVSNYYWEAQILGSLELKNISSFEFIEIPPRGQFLLELLKNGIQIFDLRNGGRVEWKPSEDELLTAREDL